MTNSLIFKCPKLNKKKQTKYHTVETNPNIKTVKREQIDTDNTQIMTAHFPVLVQALQ